MIKMHRYHRLIEPHQLLVRPRNFLVIETIDEVFEKLISVDGFYQCSVDIARVRIERF
jgi:hypothetical protein